MKKAQNENNGSIREIFKSETDLDKFVLENPVKLINSIGPSLYNIISMLSNEISEEQVLFELTNQINRINGPKKWYEDNIEEREKDEVSKPRYFKRVIELKKLNQSITIRSADPSPNVIDKEIEDIQNL